MAGAFSARGEELKVNNSRMVDNNSLRLASARTPASLTGAVSSPRSREWLARGGRALTAGAATRERRNTSFWRRRSILLQNSQN